MKKHFNLTTTEDNGKSLTTTNTSTEHPEELLRILALAGQPAPAEPENCGCGQTPCMSTMPAEAVEEDMETEYKPTPKNDKLDLDDFSKKTADGIPKQKKRLMPSKGDNPLEYSLDEEAIYDALMLDFDESYGGVGFGMFSQKGDAIVGNIIEKILDKFFDDAVDVTNSERDSLRMDAFKKLFQELEELSENEKYEEAMDTDVREQAAAYMDKGINRIYDALDKAGNPNDRLDNS